ncbi:hypothetical protein SLEP1_g20932 [Rubroshorea leprosula]|uniref:Pentatricopeptide repeat-containing protein n=1 Tax=Rubroshorea leprosula TaxID=152421 RepID=A0AAV5JDH7_9ROSI|nr:hypothetical protein SLEP1_g20932 [Rubroshorea leprosula]
MSAPVMGHCPNAVTYTTLINGYCKIGDLGTAHKLLDEMHECGVVPNSLAYSVLIRWVFRRRDVEYGRELMRKLWERMKDENDPSLNTVVFANLIDSLCREGFFNEGFRIAEETPQGMSVNEEFAYGHMIDMLFVELEGTMSNIQKTTMAYPYYSPPPPPSPPLPCNPVLPPPPSPPPPKQHRHHHHHHPPPPGAPAKAPSSYGSLPPAPATYTLPPKSSPPKSAPPPKHHLLPPPTPYHYPPSPEPTPSSPGPSEAPPSKHSYPPTPAKSPTPTPKSPPDYQLPPPKPTPSGYVPVPAPPLYGAPSPLPLSSVPPSSEIASSPPGTNHTTVIAVCVSLGGAFFLAFLLVGLICMAKKKKKPVMVPAAAACIEEHEVIQETITTGPCGEQTVTVTVEDDVVIHEEMGAVPVSQLSLHGGGAAEQPCEPGLPSTGPYHRHHPHY